MAVVIKCIVQDKKAVDVVRLLKQFALEPPVVDPIDDISAANSPVKKNTSDITGRQCVYDLVHNWKGKTITAKDIRLHVTQHGHSERSYSYPLARLVKEGFLKKTKEPFTYEVVKK